MMWEEHWGDFVEGMERRLTAGCHEYGDRSFSADPDKLIGEMMQECEDIMGWGYILWCRLHRLKDMVDDSSPDDAVH